MESLEGKKIRFVITKSNWGGAQAYVYALCVALKDRGADVAVVLGGTGLPGASTGPLADKLKTAGIQTILLTSFARDISLLREWKAFQELYKIVKNERPDVLHLNSSKAGGLGALVGRLAHVPRIIFTAHGWAYKEPRSPLSKLLVWLASWQTVSFCTKVIVLSLQDCRNAPILFSRRKLVRISNGITPFTLFSQEEARAHLQTMGVTRSAHTWLLMQAELHRNKGIDSVLEAFHSLSSEFQDCILVVMGEGEERQALQAQVSKYGLEDRVFMIGFVPDSRTYLKAGSLFLMSSRKEGMPMALLEAGYAELPIISTAVGAIPEMITDDVDGCLVPSGDIDALTKAMRALLENSSHAQQLAQEFSKKVATEFSEEKMLEKTFSLYIS